MDYKLKYEKALARAQEALNDGTISRNTIAYLQDIFPELAESEDEKTREELITLIENLKCADHRKKRWIAWLEKQGEQKPIIEMKSPEESIGISSEEYNNIVNECLYGESTSANKVEPKFKVGDWIIGRATENEPRQIAEITKEGYKSTYGGWYGFSFEEDMRLWTIQDAKEGDVLAFSYASQNYILIYKGLYKKSLETKMSVFCFYSVEEDTYYDETDSFHIMNRGEIITPATKEQRDILFQKIKEAGYEWDAEKKELKKIEQSSQRMISAEAKEAMYDKPAWSEEDELVIKDIEEAITNYWHGYTQNILLDWLKSLEQRIGG